MAKYKIIKEFVLNGVPQILDSVVELEHKVASLRSIQGNIEKYVPEAPKVEAPAPVVEAPKVDTPSTPEAPVPPTDTLPQTTMNKYEVLEAFEIDGVNQEVGAILELSDEGAAELGSKVKKVEASA